MATKLTLAEVQVQYLGAWEAEVEDMDPEEIADLVKDMMDLGEREYWEHNGALRRRTWWAAMGWHYGEWNGTSWKCPDAGEVVCPWGKE